MLKIIVLFILFINPLFVFANSRSTNYNGISFRNFATISAILDQCDLKGLEADKQYIAKVSKEDGLKIALINNLSSEDIGQEVVKILYELDKKYPEEIPLSVCMTTLKDFKFYLKNKKSDLNK